MMTHSELEQYLGKFDTTPLNQFQQLPQPELVKHILIGPAPAVTGTINLLHVLGYAHVADWSPLQPIANSSDVVSVTSRQIMTR